MTDFTPGTAVTIIDPTFLTPNLQAQVIANGGRYPAVVVDPTITDGPSAYVAAIRTASGRPTSAVLIDGRSTQLVDNSQIELAPSPAELGAKLAATLDELAERGRESRPGGGDPDYELDGFDDCETEGYANGLIEAVDAIRKALA